MSDGPAPDDDEPPRVVRVFRCYAVTVACLAAAGSLAFGIGVVLPPRGYIDDRVLRWGFAAWLGGVSALHAVASMRHRGSRWWMLCRVAMWSGVTNVVTLAPSIVFLVLWSREPVTSWYLRTPAPYPPRRA